MPLLYAIIGGGIGSGLRYLMTDWTHKQTAGVFPWGTLWVNLIGSCLIGILWELSERVSIAPDLRVFVLVGILGGFTTFSSYALETINLFRAGETGYAFINIITTNVLGLVLVVAGVILSKELLSFMLK
ncbi:MAG: fluoride efflux transporter CrcB [bacterium]|nr:fluoride efflux transporter CrcB [bacterium]MDD5354438.1 fluoride efflux transporter CrcB [bacterium]MDD5756088.1 fluoride efflux transporter CrcB [bacterium]